MSLKEKLQERYRRAEEMYPALRQQVIDRCFPEPGAYEEAVERQQQRELEEMYRPYRELKEKMEAGENIDDKDFVSVVLRKYVPKIAEAIWNLVQKGLHPAGRIPTAVWMLTDLPPENVAIIGLRCAIMAANDMDKNVYSVSREITLHASYEVELRCWHDEEVNAGRKGIPEFMHRYPNPGLRAVQDWVKARRAGRRYLPVDTVRMWQDNKECLRFGSTVLEIVLQEAADLIERFIPDGKAGQLRFTLEAFETVGQELSSLWALMLPEGMMLVPPLPWRRIDGQEEDTAGVPPARRMGCAGVG